MFEDPSNRARLAKLLRFQTSAFPESLTSLNDYVSRMKPKQEHIYYIAGATRAEVCVLFFFPYRFVTVLFIIQTNVMLNIYLQVERSPFVERLHKKGYEVLYLIEAIDEYAISSLPEFEGKKFQNAAKEGLTLSQNKEKLEKMNTEYEPLTKWLAETALKDKVWFMSNFFIKDAIIDCTSRWLSFPFRMYSIAFGTDRFFQIRMHFFSLTWMEWIYKFTLLLIQNAQFGNWNTPLG